MTVSRRRLVSLLSISARLVNLGRLGHPAAGAVPDAEELSAHRGKLHVVGTDPLSIGS